ncbi:MAG: hypothetical protein Q4D88_02870 [Anaerococcus sp.]|nr:hypothetical protein [Anaerococcus sp.]
MKKRKIALVLSLLIFPLLGTSLAQKEDQTDDYSLDIVYYDDSNLDDLLKPKPDKDNEDPKPKEDKDQVEKENLSKNNEDTSSKEDKDQAGNKDSTSKNQESNPKFKFPEGSLEKTGQKSHIVKKLGNTYEADATDGVIKGNRMTGKYHLASSPDYKKISIQNVTYFASIKEAEDLGYTRAYPNRN